MKTVFLHLGKHRTGSTSIQRFLSCNRDALLRQGFCVVSNDDVRDRLGVGYRLPNETNNVTMAHALLRECVESPIRALQGDPFDGRDRRLLVMSMNGLLKDIPEPNLIISAEAFSFLRTAEERTLYDMLFDGLQVIPLLCVREKNQWLESWMSLKRRIAARNGVALVDRVSADSPDHELLYDDRAIVAFFTGVRLLHYEMIMRTYGSVIPPFIECLGLNPAAFTEIEFRENRSPPPPLQATPEH